MVADVEADVLAVSVIRSEIDIFDLLVGLGEGGRLNGNRSDKGEAINEDIVVDEGGGGEVGVGPEIEDRNGEDWVRAEEDRMEELLIGL